ncbi:MAG: hypothetical protein M5U14_04950 [Acidimicrobiia bacterium]|nr:hypothetical protein [Acidimicrobiia bacterium]
MTTLIALLFAVFGFGIGLARLADNSFLWHLQTGRLILDSGIPREDPFSFTAAGTPWIAQSWLAELLYGVLDRSVLGAFGIRLLAAAATAAVALLAFRLALRIARDRFRAASVALVSLAGLLTIWSPRPLLFGVLALVVTLWAVEAPRSWVGRRPEWVLPLLLWGWANVHGSFVLGFAYLGLHLVGRWTEGAPPWRDREGRLLMGAGLGAVAVFLNPYGIRLVLFPFDLLARGDVLGRIKEWQSPSFTSLQGRVLAVWLATVLVVLARGRTRPGRRDVVVVVPFVLLAFWAQRNIAVAPLVALPVVARAVRAEADRPDERSPVGWAIVAVLLAAALGLGVQAAGEPDFALGAHPVEAMGAVEDAGLLGARLLADDGWGGYLILAYWPEQLVFIDDRYDMYPEELSEDYFALQDGGSGWEEVLDRYDVEAVLWEADRPLAALLDQAEGWERLHADDQAVVYVRRDVASG